MIASFTDVVPGQLRICFRARPRLMYFVLATWDDRVLTLMTCPVYSRGGVWLLRELRLTDIKFNTEVEA